jgi:hypothetical protein
MPYSSIEIRWFATDRNTLWNIYEALSPQGTGHREPDRTDHYLRADLTHTGVKVREGNHEIKVKLAPDEPLAFGTIEHWIKWSSAEAATLLDLVPAALRAEWIAVEKQRHQKHYTLTADGRLRTADPADFSAGCGVEFTTLYLPALDLTRYTLGLEAFGPDGRRQDILRAVLRETRLGDKVPEECVSCGYPAFLAGELA